MGNELFDSATTVDLQGKTVVALKSIARSMGHKGTKLDYLTKEQLVTLIQGGESASEEQKNESPGAATLLATGIQQLLQEKGLLTMEMVDRQIARAMAELKNSFATLPEEVQETLRTLGEIVNELNRRVAELNEEKVVTIEVKKLDQQTKQKIGYSHKSFQDLYEVASLNLAEGSDTAVNVWLVGPAGTGKTTAAAQLAKALDLPFYFNGAIDSEYKLRGFIDAQGKIVSTAFRRAYIEGGVYLFDEVDSSLPGALLAFNAALANHHYDFPDGVHERHPKFICLAAANTYGLGADFQYVGRMKQDAAFLDRWVQLKWPIDEALERAIAKNDEWVKYVQGVREKVQKHGIQVVVSPRASIFGARLLARGITRDKVVEMTVRKSMTADQWRMINA
jgi:hypothetical protein